MTYILCKYNYESYNFLLSKRLALIEVTSDSAYNNYLQGNSMICAELHTEFMRTFLHAHNK